MNKNNKEEDFITKEINKIISVLNLENVRNWIAVEGSTYENIAEAKKYLMLEDLPIFNNIDLFYISNITYWQMVPHFKKCTIALYNMLKENLPNIEDIENISAKFSYPKYAISDTHILEIEDVSFQYNKESLSNWFYFKIVKLHTKQDKDKTNIVSKKIMIYFLNTCIATIPVIK